MIEETELLSITAEEIAKTEKLYRTQFINSLAGIRQISLIGTKSKNGHENVAIFNSLIHLGAHPPLFGLISRPASVERDTLRNIKETKSYTVNFLHKSWVKQAHQTSARYSKEQSEFEATGLSPQYMENCWAPFVQEATIKVEMKLQEIVDIKINATIMIIGSIETVHIPKDRIGEDGLVKPLNLLLSGGLDAYYTSDFLQQLPYAKP